MEKGVAWLTQRVVPRASTPAGSQRSNMEGVEGGKEWSKGWQGCWKVMSHVLQDLGVGKAKERKKRWEDNMAYLGIGLDGIRVEGKAGHEAHLQVGLRLPSCGQQGSVVAGGGGQGAVSEQQLQGKVQVRKGGGVSERGTTKGRWRHERSVWLWQYQVGLMDSHSHTPVSLTYLRMARLRTLMRAL